MTDLLTIRDMNIKILPLGAYMTNCYIISRGSRSVIIDPGDDERVISAYLEENGLEPEAILLTHGHFDHIFAAEALRRDYRIKLYVHMEEKELLLDPLVNCTADFNRDTSIAADVYTQDGQELSIAGFAVRVIYTPGHTRGSSCYLFENYSILASGDTLFLESVGRTDLPTGNMGQLMDSIKNRLMKLEDSVLVLPGHGDRTTIGYERKNNPFIIESY